MVTAWLPSGMQRVRFLAGPSLLLWVAALVFGLLATHGAGAEGGQGHGAPSSVVVSAETAHPAHAADETGPSHHASAAEDPHHEDHSSHAAEDCASGQPQQASPLAEPCLVPLLWDAPPQAAEKPVTDRSGADAVPWISSRSSIVQQV